MASNVLTNNEVFDFYKANGKQKCIEYLIENDRNVSKIDSVKPTSKSYDYPLQKLLKQIETFKKGITRPLSNAQYDSYLVSAFEFPKTVVEKRIPHAKSDDNLYLKDALIREKQKNYTVLKKLVLTEAKNIGTVEQINITSAK